MTEEEKLVPESEDQEEQVKPKFEESVQADIVEITQGAANHIQAKEVILRQAGATHIESNLVHVRQGLSLIHI